MSNPESVIRSLQRISQLAKDFGIDARQRQRDRTLRREPYLIKKQYPPGIRAVIDKIEHAGMQVSPYNSRLSYRPNVERRSQTMILVNDVVCNVQLRKVSFVYIPVDGKYAVGNNKKPQKDWSRL